MLMNMIIINQMHTNEVYACSMTQLGTLNRNVRIMQRLADKDRKMQVISFLT